MFLSTNGVDWAQAYADRQESPQWLEVTFGNGFFVAVASARGPGGEAIFTSPDGTNWTPRLAEGWETINAVTYGNGVFVAAGGTVISSRHTSWSSLILTSQDGVTWRSQPLPADWSDWLKHGALFSGWPLSGVAYGADRFVAVGTGPPVSYPADVIVISADGTNWTVRAPEPAPGAGTGLNRVATGEGRSVVVDQGGRILRPGVVLGLTSPPSTGNPTAMLSLGSELGRRHAVQASTNLADWSTLVTFTNANHRTAVRDPEAGLHPRRFYRGGSLIQAQLGGAVRADLLTVPGADSRTLSALRTASDEAALPRKATTRGNFPATGESASRGCP